MDTSKYKITQRKYIRHPDAEAGRFTPYEGIVSIERTIAQANNLLAALKGDAKAAKRWFRAEVKSDAKHYVVEVAIARVTNHATRLGIAILVR
jgi:hypothetical protein